jgi:hypothetical protein
MLYNFCIHKLTALTPICRPSTCTTIVFATILLVSRETGILQEQMMNYHDISPAYALPWN